MTPSTCPFNRTHSNEGSGDPAITWALRYRGHDKGRRREVQSNIMLAFLALGLKTGEGWKHFAEIASVAQAYTDTQHRRALARLHRLVDLGVVERVGEGAKALYRAKLPEGL